MQREIVDYLVIKDMRNSNGTLQFPSYEKDISARVKGMLEFGYQPIGGVAYCPEHKGLIQAMVKYKEAE